MMNSANPKNVIPLPQRPSSDPERRLIDGLQRIYSNMPKADQKQAADVFLAMHSEGTKIARGREQ